MGSPIFDSRLTRETLPSPKRPYRLWDPTQPPIRRVPGFFPEGKAAGGINVTAPLHLMPRLRMSGAIPIRPIRALVAWTGTPAALLLSTGQVTVDLVTLFYHLLVQMVLTSDQQFEV